MVTAEVYVYLRLGPAILPLSAAIMITANKIGNLYHAGFYMSIRNWHKTGLRTLELMTESERDIQVVCRVKFDKPLFCWMNKRFHGSA